MSQQPWVNGYLEGPRWAGIREMVRDLGLLTNVEVEIQDEIKGWMDTKVYYRVRGDAQALVRFRDSLRRSVQRYNESTV